MGKKEQLKQIVSLLASDKIIKSENGSVNIAQEDLDNLVPLVFTQWTKTIDGSMQYSYNSNTKELKCTITDSDHPDQTLSHTGTITDVDSFFGFIGALMALENSDITEQKVEEIAAFYSSYLPLMLGQSLFSTSGVGFSDLASNNRELVLEKLKSTYPLCIKILQTYLKLVQQISN